MPTNRIWQFGNYQPVQIHWKPFECLQVNVSCRRSSWIKKWKYYLLNESKRRCEVCIANYLEVKPSHRSQWIALNRSPSAYTVKWELVAFRPFMHFGSGGHLLGCKLASLQHTQLPLAFGRVSIKHSGHITIWQNCVSIVLSERQRSETILGVNVNCLAKLETF